jgi:hypothetical protein
MAPLRASPTPSTASSLLRIPPWPRPVATSFEVRISPGLLGACSAQNQRRDSGPVRVPPSAEAPLRPGVLPKLRRAWLALRPVLAESIAGRLAPSIANSDSKESYRERRGSAFHRTFLREAAKPIRCFQGQILLMECPLSRTDQRWKCPFIWGEAVMPTSRSK